MQVDDGYCFGRYPDPDELEAAIQRARRWERLPYTKVIPT